MKPRYNPEEDNVLASCPDCNAVTSFDTRAFGQNAKLGLVLINEGHSYQGNHFSRIIWRFFRCNVCSRGAVAKLHDNGTAAHAVLESFLPAASEQAKLPDKAPDDVVKEFREAELVASQGAYRAASALLRSVLEKTLLKNGYDEVEATDAKGAKFKTRKLAHRIDAAADDGVITQARKQRAHESIRVLGNDILHDDWREVKQEEYDDAHLYAQRILEDLYDDRKTVEGILTKMKRAFTSAVPATTNPAAPAVAPAATRQTNPTNP
jgi:ribosomal protein S20